MERQKRQIRDPSAKKIRDYETQNSPENNFETHRQKRFRDFEIGPKFSKTHVFRLRHHSIPFHLVNTRALAL